MKFCPKCGSAIMPGNNMCTNCGEVFNNNLSSGEIISNQSVEQPMQPVAPSMDGINMAPPQPAVEQPVLIPPQDINTGAQMPLPAVEPMQPEIDMNAMTPEVPIVIDTVQQEVVPTNLPVQPQPVENVVPSVQVGEPVVPVAPTPVESVMPPTPEPVPLAPTPIVEQPVAQINEANKEEKIEKKVLTPEEKEKKANRIITILIIVISLLAIAVTVLFLFKVFSAKEESTNSKVVLTTQYNYEGFDFFLPEGVVASVEKDEFIIRDTEETWSAVITIQDGTYNTLVSNKAQLSSYFENYGYVATEAEIKEVSGTSFITTEVLMGSKNVLVAYAKASGTKIYGIVYVNELGTYDNYSLKVVGEVLASAIHSGYDDALPEGFTIDMLKETFEVAK